MVEQAAEALLREGYSYLNQVRFNRTSNDLVLQDRAIECFELAAKQAPNWDKPLVLVCYVLYKREGEGSDRILKLAREAIRRAPSVDAMEYFGKSVMIATRGICDAEWAAAEMNWVAKLADSHAQSRSIVVIYKAIVAYKQGNYSLYCQLLSEFVESAASFRPYLWTQAQTSSRRNYVDLRKDREWTGIEFESLPPLPSETDLLVCASCELNYLKRYAKFLFTSFKKNCPRNYTLHVVIVCNPEDQDQCMEEAWALGQEFGITDRLLITKVKLSCGENKAPIASLARLLAAEQWREQTPVPIVTIDFDSAFRRDLSEAIKFLEGHDIGLRVRKGAAPWERFTAGTSIFLDSLPARVFLKAVRAHANDVVDVAKAQWFIDQNCLEAAWRHCSTQGPALRVVDIAPFLERFIALPTGAEERKLRVLQEAAE